jgi:outer membrane protein assembly factor BamB
MCPRRVLWLVPVLLLGTVRAAEPDPEVVHAEKTLKDAGVGADAPSLLQFFRERTLTDADRGRLGGAVRRLGDEDFDTREKAAAELARAGRKALPLLRPALQDEDRERARRAEQCVQEIESGKDLVLAAAAARVLAGRRPDGAAAALLGYLPSADDEATEDALVRALAAVGVRDGVPDASLLRALTDAEPLRRAAAAHVLGRAVPDQRAAVRRLFADPDARVRYEAADALVRRGDREAVPVLIALLGDGPMPLAWCAQETLFRLAGEKAPPQSLSEEEPAKRAAIADAWRAWWRDAARKDLTKINLDEALQGVNVICELTGGGKPARVWACRADGKPLWEIKDVGASDAELLPNGHVLIAEYYSNQVTERDRSGKVVWSKSVNRSPTTCRRLPNGNTFIATFEELTEVDPKGTAVYSYKNPVRGDIYRARRLVNGHLLFVCAGDQLVELDARGKQVRAVKLPVTAGNWSGVEPLPGNRFLVAASQANKVIEIDAEGKVLWECASPDPTTATRLPNGNTLVSCNDLNCVAEYDRAGKEVWKLKRDGHVFCVRRY